MKEYRAIRTKRASGIEMVKVKKVNNVDRILIDWTLIKQSYQDLFQAHKPKDIDKFTEWYIKKYKLSKDMGEQLKKIVRGENRRDVRKTISS